MNVVLLLAAACICLTASQAMHRIDYAIGEDSAHFRVQSTTRPESAWLLVIQRGTVLAKPTELTTLLTTLKQTLTTDYCVLARSDTNHRLAILHLYCEEHTFANNNAVPDLENTRTYLEPLFGADMIILERNNEYTTPRHYGRAVTDKIHQLANKNKVRRTGRVAAQNVQILNVPWHLDRLDSRPLAYDGRYAYVNDASSVNVYTMDSGVLDSNIEFEGRASQIYNAVGDGINRDCLGHGTHVAGLIGSRSFGVAKKATILAVKVLNCQGNGLLSNLLTAGEFIIADAQQRSSGKNGTRRAVINLSLGGPPSTLLDMMVQSFVKANLVVVVAAGNDANDWPQSPDACQYSPSRMGRNNLILTVGSSDRNDKRTYWSNYGSCVNVVAPGDGILSTWIGNDFDTEVDSGTSMSSPQVAGVAAMVLHQAPTASVSDVNSIVITRASPMTVHPFDAGLGSTTLVFAYIDLGVPFVPYLPPPTNVAMSSSQHALSAGPILLILVLNLSLLMLF